MIRPLGDSAWVINFSPSISKATLLKVTYLNEFINNASLQGVLETVPAYHTLTIHFDPLICPLEHLRDTINNAIALTPTELSIGRYIEIPTLYDGEDLLIVSQHTGLSVDEVIATHAQGEYLVYMLGFTPGFAYLGGMNENLNTPRLDSPRARIKAGAVGIAGNQTGIYPIDSPGGWQLIGRTPLILFNIDSCEPTLLKAGDTLRFVAISKEEFQALGGVL